MSMAAYVLPIGWLLAYFVIRFCGLASKFTTFHLRQAFGVNVIIVLLWIILKIIDIWLIQQLVGVVMLLSIAYGVISAREEKCSYQPFLGIMFHNVFTFIR